LVDAFIAYFRRTVGVLPGETGDFRSGGSENEPSSTRYVRIVLYVAILALIIWYEQFFIGLLPNGLAHLLILVSLASAITARLAEVLQRSDRKAVPITVVLTIALFAATQVGWLSGGFAWMVALPCAIAAGLLLAPRWRSLPSPAGRPTHKLGLRT
jgi:hypothetical protein